jgi:hypothetical protein
MSDPIASHTTHQRAVSILAEVLEDQKHGGVTASQDTAPLLLALKQAQTERDEARASLQHMSLSQSSVASDQRALQQIQRELEEAKQAMKRAQEEAMLYQKEKIEATEKFRIDRQRDAQNRLEMQRSLEHAQSEKKALEAAFSDGSRDSKKAQTECAALQLRLDAALTQLSTAERSLEQARASSKESESCASRLELISKDAEAAHKVCASPSLFPCSLLPPKHPHMQSFVAFAIPSCAL